METVSISDIENVVRFISHLHKDGTINPKSFKLRQWPEPKGPERYISVNRYESASLVADLQAYDKGRNLVCALMNVGEIRKTSLFLGDTEEYQSNMMFETCTLLPSLLMQVYSSQLLICH